MCERDREQQCTREREKKETFKCFLSILAAASLTAVTLSYDAFPLHDTVRFGTARYGTVRLGSVRVGLHFHCNLVPL